LYANRSWKKEKTIMSKSLPIKVVPADDTPAPPVYLIRDGGFYRTVDHAQGWSEHPDYELKPDGQVYRTRFHPLGTSAHPDYRFKPDGALYRTGDHPEGSSTGPDFLVKD
jgi:hypothetical protein